MRVLFLGLLFLTGCGSIVVSPHGCKSNSEYGTSNEKYERVVERKYYTFFNDEEVKLKELIDCPFVGRIKISLEKKFLYINILKIYYSDTVDVEDAKNDKRKNGDQPSFSPDDFKEEDFKSNANKKVQGEVQGR